MNEVFSKFPPSKLLYGTRKKHFLGKPLVEKFNMINAEEVKVGHRLVWKKNYSTGTADLVEKFDYAYVVPFLRNLENLLRNPEVRLNVENPKKGKTVH